MTFDQRETSYSGGAPLRLLDIIRGNRHWRYTSGDRVERFNNSDFDVVGDTVVVSALRESLESKKSQRTISLPRNLPVMDNWWPNSPEDTVAIIIFAKHFGDDDAAVEYTGRVMGCVFENDGTATLTCEPTQSAAHRRGRSRCWQIGCPHVLGSQGDGLCNVDLQAHAIVATAESIDGLAIQSAAFLAVPNGRLAGGFVEWDGEFGMKRRRDIDRHDGATIWLDYPPYGLPPGTVLTTFPGCAGTRADCEYFNNKQNYGGQEHLPNRTPFDGLPVW